MHKNTLFEVTASGEIAQINTFWVGAFNLLVASISNAAGDIKSLSLWPYQLGSHVCFAFDIDGSLGLVPLTIFIIDEVVEETFEPLPTATELRQGLYDCHVKNALDAHYLIWTLVKSLKVPFDCIKMNLK